MKKQQVDTPYKGSWADQMTSGYHIPESIKPPPPIQGVVIETVRWEDRKWFNC